MRWALCIAVLTGCVSCDSTEETQAKIQQEHLLRVRALVIKDIESHRDGVSLAADKLSPGFVLRDPKTREREMRAALKFLQDPRKGIEAFVASPMTFLAAVGSDGVVIARDRKPDRMKGQDYGVRFDVVARALKGSANVGLGEFFAKDPKEPSSWSILFAAPSARKGKMVGAAVVGIPLSRMAQRLSRQLRVENAAEIQRGLGLWTYLYKGDRIFHWDTPPELDALLPSGEERAGKLAASPEGFMGEVRVHGALFVYGVFPLPELGPDVGVLIFRSEP